MVLYAAAAVLGLLAGAYGCLGLLVLIAPEMQSEASLRFIPPAGLAGAIGLPLLIRHWRLSRRSR